MTPQPWELYCWTQRFSSCIARQLDAIVLSRDPRAACSGPAILRMASLYFEYLAQRPLGAAQLCLKARPRAGRAPSQRPAVHLDCRWRCAHLGHGRVDALLVPPKNSDAWPEQSTSSFAMAISAGIDSATDSSPPARTPSNDSSAKCLTNSCGIPQRQRRECTE